LLDTLAFTARRKARDLACRAGLGLAAGILSLAGLGFLLSAVWLALAAAKGAIFASLLIGLSLVGVSALLLAVILARPRTARGRSLTPHLGQGAQAGSGGAAGFAGPGGEELDLDQLRRAAGQGRQEMERAMQGLLTQVGITPPAAGSKPALAAAFVFGLTLALQSRRSKRRR
jgi:hypothetical protein